MGSDAIIQLPSNPITPFSQISNEILAHAIHPESHKYRMGFSTTTAFPGLTSGLQKLQSTRPWDAGTSVGHLR
jgi:hypothetical protein